MRIKYLGHPGSGSAENEKLKYCFITCVDDECFFNREPVLKTPTIGLVSVK